MSCGRVDGEDARGIRALEFVILGFVFVFGNVLGLIRIKN